MINKPTLSYYSTQSNFSDPGKYQYLYTDLPKSIEDLCNIVHGLIVNPCDTKKLYGFMIDPEKYSIEANLHYIEDILAKISMNDPSSLTTTRLPQKRIAGLCRHFALLLTSILRYQGVPARVRCGFEIYYNDSPPSEYLDHWVCQYWDNHETQWQYVDPEVGLEEINAGKMITTATKIPKGEYLTAGEVWQLCRTGKMDPNNFSAPVPGIKGWWFIRANLLKDLANLNKLELVPWDYTKFMDYQFESLNELKPAEINLLDKLAELMVNEKFEEIQNLYQNNLQLQVKNQVYSYISEKPITTKIGEQVLV